MRHTTVHRKFCPLIEGGHKKRIQNYIEYKIGQMTFACSCRTPFIHKERAVQWRFGLAMCVTWRGVLRLVGRRRRQRRKEETSERADTSRVSFGQHLCQSCNLRAFVLRVLTASLAI